MWCLFVQDVRNINTSGEIPYPFNTTIDSAAYVGFEKLTDNKRYLSDYIQVSLSSVQHYIAQYCVCVSLNMLQELLLG